MTIEESLHEELKAAMKSRATDVVNAIRQLKSKVQETVNDPRFSGVINDSLYRKVIRSYVGSLRKGIGELEAAGAKGAQLRRSYQREIEFFSRWLPQTADEDETRRRVQQARAELGSDDPKRAGQLMGQLMKTYRDQLDPGLTKRIVDEELAN